MTLTPISTTPRQPPPSRAPLSVHRSHDNVPTPDIPLKRQEIPCKQIVLTKSQKQRTTVNKLKELIVPIASAARHAFNAAASKEFDDVSGKATPRTRTLYSAIGKPAILRGFDITTDIRPALEEAARKAKAGGKGKKRAREEEQEGEEETIETNRGSQVEELHDPSLNIDAGLGADFDADAGLNSEEDITRRRDQGGLDVDLGTSQGSQEGARPVKKTRRSPIPDVSVEDDEVRSDSLVSSGRASASSSRHTNGPVKKRPSQKDRSPEEAQRIRKLGREGHERRKRERAETGAQLHFANQQIRIFLNALKFAPTATIKPFALGVFESWQKEIDEEQVQAPISAKQARSKPNSKSKAKAKPRSKSKADSTASTSSSSSLSSRHVKGSKTKGKDRQRRQTSSSDSDDEEDLQDSTSDEDGAGGHGPDSYDDESDE